MFWGPQQSRVTQGASPSSLGCGRAGRASLLTHRAVFGELLGSSCFIGPQVSGVLAERAWVICQLPARAQREGSWVLQQQMPKYVWFAEGPLFF